MDHCNAQKDIAREDLGEANPREKITEALLKTSSPQIGSKSVVVRVRGSFSRADLPTVLQSCLGVDYHPSIKSFAPQADENVNIATVTFNAAPSQLLSSDQTIFPEANVTLDTHFRGLSVLFTPEVARHNFDIIAVCGLGGHAFGSFKERNGTHMWLRDALPNDVENARVLTYGYDSHIHGSTSFQTIESLASSLRNHVEGIKSLSGSLHERPIIFIAHSLGGLVLKQALVQSVKAKSKLARCTRGALFFGVPNQGMHISSLIPMAAGQPNEALLHSLHQESELLRSLSRDFCEAFTSREAQIFCFYETKTSPTAVKGPHDEWRMSGEHVIFVGSASATHCRFWESEAYHVLGLDRDHSGLVKFKLGDEDYIKVRNVLHKITNDHYRLAMLQPMVSEVDQKLTDQCLKAIGHTNPVDTMRRIEITKDDLVAECNEWIKSDPCLEEWKNDPKQRLLWLSGDPGKGKTMLMMSLIQELKTSNMKHQSPLTFFFCQSTDPRLNTAHAVLSGLLWLLIHENPILGRYLHEDYRHQKEFLGGPDGFVALCRIMTELLQDVALPTVYILIDALDECDEGRGGLLRYICENSSSEKSKAKWLVSSRNHLPIEREFNVYQHGVLSLELNAAHISAAVECFIHRKVDELAKRNNYSHKLRERVQRHMMENADSTFLWVALACRHLNNTARRNVPAELARLPAGLSSLYDQMLEQLRSGQDHEFTMAIIKCVTIAKRPLLTQELIPLLVQGGSDHFEDELDNDDLLDLIKSCGSFITVREGVIYLIHQSVKDYLLEGGKRIFSSLMSEEHCTIVDRSLTVLSRELTKSIYSNDCPRPASSNRRSKENFGYVSCFWVDHLAEYQNICAVHFRKDSCRHEIEVYEFMMKHLLKWIQLLCFLGQLRIAPVALGCLEAVAKRYSSERLYQVTHDATRFLMHSYLAIEEDPSQIYNFGLTFAPKESLVRQIFSGQMPSWVSISPWIGDSWSQKQHTLNAHDGCVLVAFSPDSRQLASASDYTLKLWDTVTGKVMLALEGHDKIIESVLYNPDGRQLATTSNDNTVKLWDVLTGRELWTLYGHTSRVSKAAFSRDGKQLVSISDDHTIRLWNTATGKHVRTFNDHTGPVMAVEFGPDGRSLVSGSGDKTVRLWNTETEEASRVLYSHGSFVRLTILSPDGQQLASVSADGIIGLWDNSTQRLSWLRGHTKAVGHIAFSPNGRQLASSSEDSTTRLWDIATRECSHIFERSHDPGYRISPIAFSPDSQHLAVLFEKNLIQLRDPATGEVLQTFQHDDWIKSLVFSPDGRQLAIQLNYKMIELWDVAESSMLQMPETHTDELSSIIFSLDGQHVVSGSKDDTVRLWNATTGQTLQTLKGHWRVIKSVAINSDSVRIASSWDDLTIRVWDAASDKNVQSFENRDISVRSLVAFSLDLQLIALVAQKTEDWKICIWNFATGEILYIAGRDDDGGHYNDIGGNDDITSLIFSPDGKYLASGSMDQRLRLWETTRGERVASLKEHTGPVRALVFRPDGKQLASGASGEILLWDTENWHILHKFVRYDESGSSIAFSPDGQMLAFSVRGEEVQLWDLAVGEVLIALESDGAKGSELSFFPDGQCLAVIWNTPRSRFEVQQSLHIWDIAANEAFEITQNGEIWSGPSLFSPDGWYLASASSDGTIWLFDFRLVDIKYRLKHHTKHVLSLAFSPEGQHLASGSDDGMINLWDVTTGEASKTLKRHKSGVDLLSFSSNGEQLISGSVENRYREPDSRSICLWSLETGEVLWEFSSHAILPIRSVALSPDGRQLASASDRTVRLWDISTSKLLRILTRHTDKVSSRAVSPDGMKLVSRSNESTLRLSDVASSKDLQKPEEDAASITSIAFSPDGQRLVSWFDDRTVCIWEPESDSPSWSVNNKSSGQYWQLVANGDDRTEIGFLFDENTNWLSFDGYQLIWLPPEFRPKISAVHGNRIAVGCVSGMVYILGVHPDRLPTVRLIE